MPLAIRALADQLLKKQSVMVILQESHRRERAQSVKDSLQKTRFLLTAPEGYRKACAVAKRRCEPGAFTRGPRLSELVIYPAWAKSRRAYSQRVNLCDLVRNAGGLLRSHAPAPTAQSMVPFRQSRTASFLSNEVL